MNKRILVIEDDPRYAHLIRAMLALTSGSEFEPVCVARLSEGLKHLREESPDLVLLDLSLPDSQGLATMAKVQAQAPDVPIVVLTGLEDEATAITAMQEGTQDYLVKGQVDSNLLRRSVLYAIERKRAEDALRKSEEKYKTLVDNIMVGIFRTTPGPTGRFLEVNKAMEEITGYSREELLSMNVSNLYLHPEEREDEVLSTQKNVTTERNFRKKDGTTIIVVGLKTTMRDGTGAVTHFDGILEDITERKQAEDALRESEKRYRTLFESVAEGILIADIETKKFKYANPAICTMLGYSQEELTTMSAGDIHPKTSLEHVVADFDAQARGEKVLSSLPCLKKDGTIVYADINATKAIIDGRECNIGFFTDITERKQAEEQRRESEEIYRTVVEGAHDMIQSVTPDGRIIFVNRAWLDTLGYTGAELPSLNLFQIIHPDSRLHCQELCAQVINGESILEVETSFLTKDGREILAEGNVAPRYIGGKVVATQGIFRDITERKRVEEERRELDRMKSEFVANVSHELRTPLHSIRGFTRLLIEDKVPEPEVQKEFLSIIDNQSQNLEELINNLLDASRIESGRFKMQKHQLLIKDVISGVIESFYTIASEKGITINTEIPETLPEVEADGERLKQVLNNLLSNAIKFNNGSSSVTVTGVAKGGELIVRVTDQGVGIPEEAMSHLFERFYRAKDTAMVGGSGLGLYVSKQIIEAHGGHIWAESKAGRGSTFSFALPLGQVGGDSHE